MSEEREKARRIVVRYTKYSLVSHCISPGGHEGLGSGSGGSHDHSGLHLDSCVKGRILCLIVAREQSDHGGACARDHFSTCILA